MTNYLVSRQAVERLQNHWRGPPVGPGCEAWREESGEDWPDRRVAVQEMQGGKGGWSLVQDCGLPTQGLSVPHGISLADLDGDGSLEIIALHGGAAGSITIWKQKESPEKTLTSK